MLHLRTGLPGSYKTALALLDFLDIKNRPKYATLIKGFDYDKHNVTRIDDLTDWMSLPDGSVIFVDEGQQFLRPRKREAELPKWISDFETHRHRGFDFYVTTQHPMFIDIHFRRLTEDHVHNHRFSGFKRASCRTWTGCQDDPDDYHSMKKAQVVMRKPPKWIFDEYESTVLDTHKFKIPTKLLFFIPLILVLLGSAIYQLYPLYKKYHSSSATLSPTIHSTTQTSSNVSNPLNSQSQPVSSVSGSSGSDTPNLKPSDFVPASELAPWSAPVYRQYAHIDAVPIFVGCIEMAGNCKCTTQQGTILNVEKNTCMAVIHGDAMPFNPFHHDESRPSITNMDTMQHESFSSLKHDTSSLGQSDHLSADSDRSSSVSSYEQQQLEIQKQRDTDWQSLSQNKTSSFKASIVP